MSSNCGLLNEVLSKSELDNIFCLNLQQILNENSTIMTQNLPIPSSFDLDNLENYLEQRTVSLAYSNNSNSFSKTKQFLQKFK